MEKRLEGQDGRLRELREHSVLTQLELAEMSGVHFTTISKLEAGTATARPSTIRKLAKALNVSPQYLKGLTDEPVSSGRPGMLSVAVGAMALVSSLSPLL